MTFSRMLTVAVVLLAATCVSSVLAREATLKLKDGRRITGELVAETGEAVSLKVAGIETVFPREDIASIEVEKTLAERFAADRAAIADDDLNARYDLARRMFDTTSKEGYELSLKELDSILTAKPDHSMAKLLRNVVAERLKLEPAPTNPQDPVAKPPVQPKPEGEGEEGEPAPPPAGIEAPRKLSAEEINLIKVFEVRLDSKPNVVIPRKVLEEVLKRYQDNREMELFLGNAGNRRWFALKGYEQLGVLFALQAREYYKDVMIRDVPDTIKTFQASVHRQYLIGHCGRCHGEGRAKGLYVITRPATHENTVYSNLLIIRRTQGGNLPLVFTAQPHRSLLIQYGLPQKFAATPHPEVPGFTHYFQSFDDPRFTAMRDWIGKLYGEGDDYPVEFKAPWTSENASGLAPAEGDAKPAEPKPADAKPAPAPKPAGAPAPKPAPAAGPANP